MRFNPLHLRGRRVSTRLDQMTDLVPAAQGSPALQIFPEGGDRQVAQFAPRRVAQGPAQVSSSSPAPPTMTGAAFSRLVVALIQSARVAVFGSSRQSDQVRAWLSRPKVLLSFMPGSG